MAERRMFAKTIIDSDAFLDMPLSTQSLYFHLNMRADDEGFVNSPKKIQRMIGASDDDLKVLITKNFIIPFESGVVVIKHWKIHNYIRKDRLVETVYKEEKEMLAQKENGAYTFNKIQEILVLEEEGQQEETLRQKVYRESSLPYSFEYKIRQAFVWKKCPVCNCTMSNENNLTIPTIQHNIPISKGGKHEIENISVICRHCNTSIKDKETPQLNTEEVIKVWDDICQTNDRQITDNSQHRLGKDRLELGKDSIELDNNIPASEEKSSTASAKASKHKYGEYKNVLLKDEELQKLKDKYENWEELIKYLDEYIEMKGYKAKSHYLCIGKWVVDAVNKENLKKPKSIKDTSKVVDF